MAKSTANLQLYEKESTDGKDTFNITQMLNNNWDKLDADSKTKADDISNIKADIGTATLTTADKTLKGAINEVKNAMPTSLPANGGDAETAQRFKIARNIALSGDITGTVSFDGSENVDIATTLKDSGVSSGTYKSVSVDTKGRVTAGSNPTTLSEYGIDDAYTKAQSDANYAPSGYGLGGAGKRLGSGIDANTLANNGWYDINNATNLPTDIGTGYAKLLVICSGDPDYITQLCFTMTTGTLGTSYIRELRAGTWSSWRKFTNKDELDAHINDTTKHTGTATTTNSGNAYSVTIPNVSSLSDMLEIRVKFNSASSGAITLNVNGLGTKNVVDYFGNAVTNVRQYLIANLCYEASTGNFILLGKGGGGTATASHVLAGDTFTNNSGGNIPGTMVNNSSQVNALSVGSNGTNKYFRIPNGAYLQNTGSGSPEIVASATQIDSNIITGNIKSGVSICGVSGKSSVVDTADATAGVGDIVSGKTAYVNGNKVNGSASIESLGGKRYASGTAKADSNGGFTVTGLPFKPKTIVFYGASDTGYYTAFGYSDDITRQHLDQAVAGGSYYNGHFYFSQLGLAPQISSNGFQIYGSTSANLNNASINWIAIE